jgi:fumarylacetoacetate (FAA) hydrolase
MKLASLKSGGRDGTLVVVSDDLTRALAVPQIASSLEGALEDWRSVEPQLALAAKKLEAGDEPGIFELDVDALASPLPRSHQFLDGSVYLRHMEKARKARGAAMPPNYTTEPLMYQGLSHAFYGPTEPATIPDETFDLDYEAEIAVVVDDVPMGVGEDDAAAHIKLVMLLNDYTFRALTATELPKGFGFLQAKPARTCAPVAVTLDELGAAWDGERFHLAVRTEINGQLIGEPNAGVGMFFTYPQLIAHAARTRTLAAGTIIGAGAISNEDSEFGCGCLAEARLAERARTGTATTSWLRFGDTVRMQAFDENKRSVFGAIDQPIVAARTDT